MYQFSTKREKRLWLFIIATILAIYSTLFLGQPLLEFIKNTRLDIPLFLSGMLSVALLIFLHGLQRKPRIKEIISWLGIITVYVLLFMRLGLSERTHLMEYSILAILIHEALLERVSQGQQVWRPAILASLVAIVIGTLDELLQLFIPHRVFDVEDIIFNILAILMAIGSSALIASVRNRR